MQTPDLFSSILQNLFPRVGSFLDHQTDFQFLVAILLSAQMTDEGVNKATKKLFQEMHTPYDAVQMGQEKIYSFVRSVNYAPTKAKHILLSAQKILDQWNGEIPRTRKELITLPGVGSKTAGVFVLQKGYDYAFPVDTHIARVSKSFGFTTHSDPNKIEADLQKLFPKEEWNDLHLRIILYGRKYLTAKKIPPTSQKAWEDLLLLNKWGG